VNHIIESIKKATSRSKGVEMGEWQAVARSSLVKVPSVVTHSILRCRGFILQEHVFPLTSFNNTIRYKLVKLLHDPVHMSSPLP
jgi:hypothetical protein